MEYYVNKAFQPAQSRLNSELSCNDIQDQWELGPKLHPATDSLNILQSLFPCSLNGLIPMHHLTVANAFHRPCSQLQQHRNITSDTSLVHTLRSLQLWFSFIRRGGKIMQGTEVAIIQDQCIYSEKENPKDLGPWPHPPSLAPLERKWNMRSDYHLATLQAKS